jgi:hypothetical protein
MLTITPAMQRYVTDGVTPAMGTYTVTAQYPDGRTDDVTTQVTYMLEPFGLGSITQGKYTSSIDTGGVGRLTATLGAASAVAGLELVIQKRFVDPSAGSIGVDPGSKFTGAPMASRAPDLVYPNDGVLLPPNVDNIEVHFLPGQGNTVFELTFESPRADVKVYLGCTQPTNGGCIYQPPPAVWRSVANTNRGGDPVKISLKGADAMGMSMGASTPINVSFSQDEVRGGLYYWSTTLRSIMRFDFAKAQQQATKFVDGAPTGNAGTCIGCHALSRDGKRMVIEIEGAFDGRIAILDVASKMNIVPFPAMAKSFFSSWAPDNLRFVGVDDRGSDFNLRIIDSMTGMVTQSIPNTGTEDRAANHPDWSADGNTIVYAAVQRKGPAGRSLQWATNGGIRMVQLSNAAWSAPIEIAPVVNGKHRYYPAIAPSSDYVVFNESTCPQGSTEGFDCDSDADPDAALIAAKLTANAVLVPLAAANRPGKRDNNQTRLTNSYPKWSPFNFRRTAETSSKLQWLTFSSKRAYGLRVRSDLMWLWMVGVDPSKLENGEDPSYSAFCLPFQDFSTSNHIAQWTEEVPPDIQ